MTRLILTVLLLILPVAAAAQSELSQKALSQLEQVADEIAAIDPGQVPEVLIAALIAAEEPDHLRRAATTSGLTRKLADLHLGAMPTLRRTAAKQALATYLGDRMTPAEIVRTYAALVYFGRNCYGYRSAVQGLARSTVERADDAVWLALAALPRSPSFYLRDRAALRDRVREIVSGMQSAGLVDSRRAEKLRTLPLASVDTGVGCSS